MREDGRSGLVTAEVEELDEVAIEVDELAVQRFEGDERFLAVDADSLDLLHIARRRRAHTHEQISERKPSTGDSFIPAMRDEDGDSFPANEGRFQHRSTLERPVVLTPSVA